MAFNSRLRVFVADQHGGMTIFLLIWMIIFFIFSGLAVDSSNAWREKAVLQATADSAALAAVVDIEDQTVALAQANYFADKNMPYANHGDVLFDADVEFGNWKFKVFTPEAEFGEDLKSPDDVNAVRATTFRAASNSNRLRTYFLTLSGFTAWNISAQAIAATYQVGTCLDYENVILAEGQIFINPNGAFGGAICLHSNDRLRFPNDIDFGDGAYLSMPDGGDGSKIVDAFLDANPSIKLSADGQSFEGFPGLMEALKGDVLPKIPTIEPDMATMVKSIYAGETTYLPEGDGTTSVFTGIANDSGVPIVQNVVALNLDTQGLPDDFDPNTLYKLDCGNLDSSVSDLTVALHSGGDKDFASIGGSLLDRLFGEIFAANAAEGVTYGGKTITFTSGLTGVAIVTDCDLKFNGGLYADSIFATTSSSNHAVQIVNSTPTQMGLNDNCDPGGEVTFLVPNDGDINSSAKASFYDANFYGGGDFDLAAQAGDAADMEGVAVGLNVQVAGEVHITAQATFNACGDTNAASYLPWKYRLVQ